MPIDTYVISLATIRLPSLEGWGRLESFTFWFSL
jgi:hypothetical protein